MFLCSLVVQSLHPCLLINTCLTVHTCTEDHCSTVGVRDLGNYITHNVTWYNEMASNVCTVLETEASTKLNRHDTNIQVVKGTVHTRLKEICAKAMVIALANFDVGRLKRIS